MSATRATPKKPRWVKPFLDCIRECPDITAACDAVGIARSTAYRLRQSDEDFALAWHDAHAKSLDVLEAALFKRATETDTTAAIFLLKSHRPDTYGDRTRIEHSGAIRTDLKAMTDEQLAAIADGLEAKRATA